MESYLYFDSAPRYRTKSIDEISTGVAKRLKRMCSNDNDFLQQSKKYSAYLVAGNYKQKGITRTFYKFNKQSKSTIQQKRLKSSIKPHHSTYSVLVSTILLKGIYLSS